MGSVWIVDEVLQSGRDIYTVFCVPRRAFRQSLRNRSDDQRDLADELLEAARRARDAAVERRNRWKYRRYIP